MQGDEKKKKVARDDYLNLYKETANQTKKEIPEEFTEKADKETLKKNKKQRNARFNKQPKVEEIQPSEIYLQSFTKSNPIPIGKEITVADGGSPKFQSSGFMNHFNSTVMTNKVLNKTIAGTQLNISKADNEIGVKEAQIQASINQRQNIIQARSHLKVFEVGSPGGAAVEPDRNTNSVHGSSNTGDHRSPTSSNNDKSTRRLLADMEKAKKRLLSKGIPQKPSEIDSKLREIKINPIFMNKEMNF